MKFTINCTRVPIPQGTTLYGTPVDVGPAPAFPGVASNHAAPPRASNDGDTLNLSRRVLPNRAEPTPRSSKPENIISCKNQTIFSTFNARTLTPKGRLEEFGVNAELNKIDIIAVQEHRFYHPDVKLKYHSVGSYQLVTSSATKNSVNATVGGVGFLLSPRVSDNLLNIESITPKIMILELEGNPKTTIVCAHSPHNSSTLEELEDFYTSLRSTVEQVPPHNFLVIAGDLNSKLGPDDVNFTYNKETNRNGEMLLDFLEEFNLFTSNNYFMKPKGQLWTFEYPSGVRAQLDYLIFRKKWRNSVKNSRSYSSFSSVGSDHRIVSSTVKLSLRSSKKAKPHLMKIIDWKAVSANSVLSKQFSLDVFNKFESLSTSYVDADNIEDVYGTLIKCTEEVALATLPKKEKRSQNKPSNSPSVLEARSHLKTVSSSYHRSPSKALKIQLISAKKGLDDAYLNAEVDFINGKIKKLSSEHISKRHHLAWKTIKDLSGKNSGSSVRIKGGSAKKRLENWTNHFKNLLGNKAKVPDNCTLPSVPVSDTLPIDTFPFTIKELKSATKF